VPVDKDEAALIDLVAQFEAATLDRELWNHATHLVIALVYVRTRSPDAAYTAMRDGIVRYQASLGHTGTFHETVTRAWLAIVADFVARDGAQKPLTQSARRLVDRCGDQRYLLQHYSPEVLQSDAARAMWIPPDRRPF
jgi:hypothetical protein